MNFTAIGQSAGGFAFLAVLWGLCVTIFWFVVAWRAMRAHEELADAVRDVARQLRLRNANDHPTGNG